MNILLVGNDNSTNKVIGDILESQNDINFQSWPIEGVINKLNQETTAFIDVLIVDLPSFNESATVMLKKLVGIKSVLAVLAIHIYKTPSLVKALLDVGATGYLTQDTNEEKLLKALKSISKGRRYVAA